MKKKSIFFIISILLVFGSFFVPSMIKEFLPKASATKIKQITYVEYVSATGEVVQENKQVITAEYPIIVSEVLVKVGESIKSGQPVISINREETAKKIMEATNLGSIAGLTTGVFATSYEDAYDKLPEQISSNIDGVIESITASEGDFIDKNGVILSMIGAGDLSVNLQVPENKIGNVQVGQPVEITGSGFTDKKYYGYVKSISTTARKVFSGTSQDTVIDVVVSIDDLDEKIKAGRITSYNVCYTKLLRQEPIFCYLSLILNILLI